MHKSRKTLTLIISFCLLLSLFPGTALAHNATPDIPVGLPAPQGVEIIGQSVTCATIDWDNVPGAEGYEVYCAENGGDYTLVHTTAFSVFADKDLITGNDYSYKVRAFRIADGTVAYSDMSDEISVSPRFALYYQGSGAWRFSDEVKKRACLLTAFAIVIRNMGIEATPRTVYKANGGTPISMARLERRFGVVAAQALPENSPLMDSFGGRSTSIKSKVKNYEAAVKEALKLHPEGVIFYFKKGGAAHAIVACKVDENGTIYYSDPGRNKGRLLTFKETWVRYHHHMSYGNLSEMIALDLADGVSLVLE
jgi:hypothetical protein